MNKEEIKSVLAAYSPPLSLSQIEEASEKIAKMSATVNPVPEKQVQTKSRR
jgi:hypothetical protein